MGVSSRAASVSTASLGGWGKSVAGGVVVWAHCWVLRERAPVLVGVTLVAKIVVGQASHRTASAQVLRVWLWYAVIMVVGPSVL